MEKEARQQVIEFSAPTLRLKEKGKAVIETYGNGQSLQEMEVI